jgi:hypothetical protein
MTTIPDPGTNSDSYILAAAMYTRWLAAHKAEDPDAGRMLAKLTEDSRSHGLTLGAAAEIMIGVLDKLAADGALQGGTQVFLDRQAMTYGAAADAVVLRHRGAGGQTS